MYYPVDQLLYGTDIRVTTSGPTHVWEQTYPGNCISQYIHCWAGVTGASRIRAWYDDYLRSGQGDAATDERWESVMRKMDRVDAYIAQANENDMIDNER